ncbi:MAG: glycosyltransferase [Candidatus Nitronauta litoralis]|uniref:Glycosyltransferase n=1 Tax=Candidatus Nitronauta litoralis TaxID=2705533 RepID=A0A7T0BYT2_9BACT|nr:MAG: glycosyltransferase [Candidatus Nitronauta litoralis]
MPEFELYKKNLSLLKIWDPILAQRVDSFNEVSSIEVIPAKTQNRVPVSNSISLHSRYDPVKEATTFAENVGDLKNSDCLVLGLGFAYHIKELCEFQPRTLTVIEPSIDMFKQLLQAIDLSIFGLKLNFYVNESPAYVAARLPKKEWLTVEHRPSLRLHPQYFSRLKKGMEGASCLERNSLKVLVIPPIYGGSLPTARFCFESLKNLGHQPYWVNCEKYADGFFDMQSCTEKKEHEAVLSRKYLEYLSEMIVAKAAETRPDIVLALAQAPLDRDTIRRLKDLGAPIAFWFVEDFRTLKYWEGIAPAYDSFFTIQRGEFFSKLESIECPPFYYLPQACHPPIHSPVKLTANEMIQFGSDLSFMGAAYYNRTQLFSQLLNYDFKIWGTGWDGDSVYGSCLQKSGKRISSEDTVKIYNASKINLNLHSSSFHESVNPNGDFVNPRTFEIGACGGFQLVDQRSELCSLFDIGEELITFENGKELKEKINHYLELPAERSRIAKASQDRVLKDHTFSHRMREMLVQIYIDHEEKVTRNLKRNLSQREMLLEQVGSDTGLFKFLQKYESSVDLDLKRICQDIQDGEGELTDTELLLLMVDQVVKK